MQFTVSYKVTKKEIISELNERASSYHILPEDAEALRKIAACLEQLSAQRVTSIFRSLEDDPRNHGDRWVVMAFGEKLSEYIS